MNFQQLAEEVLARMRRPMTANEIWNEAVALGLDKQLKTKGKTPWATLGARLYVEVRDSPNTAFEAIGRRPTRFWLRKLGKPPGDKNDVGDRPEQAIEQSHLKYTERDMHPLLVKFVDGFYHFRGARLKTIYHETSRKSKKGYNHWLHPDVVGVYFSFHDKVKGYDPIIIDFQSEFAIPSVRLFSFELKTSLRLGNLRESYFQAVSNSSWANEGYLVTLDLDEDVMEEARRLANAFGIGLIRLDAEDIETSQIVVPAAFRESLDIDTMDRMAADNPDFKKFLQNIMDDRKIKKVNPFNYDRVLDSEEFAKYLIEKGFVSS